MDKIKIFLVEDEFVIRDGIKRNIDWDANDFEFVGDAADGEMAWKEISVRKPDIVITDIRMPFMDGLELSKLIKKELPKTRIVVLSGYEEFEYAKECIKIGISEYLLKPISREDLLAKVNSIANEIREKRKEENISDGDYGQIDRETISEFLHFGKPEDASDFVDKFLDGTKESMQSQIFRQYIAMDVYFVTINYLEGIGIDKEKQDELAIDMSSLATPELTIECLKKLLAEACRLKGTVKNSHNQEIVDKVLKYVEKHYQDEELSLNQVAEHVSFSPNHLSTVFHQEYGQSFVKYLTNFRINKAKVLLREKGMKSSDVCYEVGYKDPHYFSSIFKKTLGMTPTQYREGKV